jgi:transcriptional regulator with XRE-family HTH domain
MKQGNNRSMESINSRIARLRSHLGMNQSQFARKLGVTSTLINKVEAMKSPLTDVNIRLICFTFGVREEWLREGKGEMMDDEALLSDQERQLLELFRRLSPKARILATEYLEKIISDEQALRGDKPEESTG